MNTTTSVEIPMAKVVESDLPRRTHCVNCRNPLTPCVRMLDESMGKKPVAWFCVNEKCWRYVDLSVHLEWVKI